MRKEEGRGKAKRACNETEAVKGREREGNTIIVK